MKYEQNRSDNGGGVVYVLKVRHLNQHDSTVWMKTLTILSGQLHLLHHFRRDCAHLLGV